jgi:hypothetical protein
MFGGNLNYNTKEHHSNPERTGHTNGRNYLGLVVYSALQKRYFLPDFPVIAEKNLLEG